MATKLLFLEGFDVVQATAQVVTSAATDDDRTDLQLDQTCFYPRGGGQDWDTGSIQNDDGSVQFDVEEVRLDEQGIVHHIGAYRKGQFQPGDSVSCIVDTQRRTINTRLHSAGHVIDLAVDQLNLPWIPGRAGHYPHMSFVEYEGSIEPNDAEAVAQQIQQIANDVVREGGHNKIAFMPVSEMHTICRHVPTNIPAHKPARVVIYRDTFGVPCGGTHVADLHDVGGITITKVKHKKGVIKVSYAVEGINTPDGQ